MSGLDRVIWVEAVGIEPLSVADSTGAFLAETPWFAAETGSAHLPPRTGKSPQNRRVRDQSRPSGDQSGDQR
jgi:hypothetical protein